jgi:Peptidase family M41
MTIVPRGRALGVTFRLPEIDAVSMNYQQLLADIDVCMGGRAAEEAIYGVDRVSSGISSDLSKATDIAYQLVTQFGFSKKLGNFDLWNNYRNLSGQTKKEIEVEVRTIIEDSRERANDILKSKRSELELLKDALIDHETLDRDQILKVIKGEKIPRVSLEPTVPSSRIDDKNDSGGRGRDDLQDGKGGRKKETEIGPKGGMTIKLPGMLIPPPPPRPQPSTPEPTRTGDGEDHS